MDGHPSNFFPVIADVPQGLILALTLPLYQWPVFCYYQSYPPEDSTYHSNVQSPQPLPILELNDNCRSMHMPILKDLWIISKILSASTLLKLCHVYCHTKNPTIHTPLLWMAHFHKIRNRLILLALLSNMISAGTDTLPQLPHQLLKGLDFLFELEGTVFLRIWIGTFYVSVIRPFLENCYLVHPEKSHPTYWWSSSY